MKITNCKLKLLGKKVSMTVTWPILKLCKKKCREKNISMTASWPVLKFCWKKCSEVACNSDNTNHLMSHLRNLLFGTFAFCIWPSIIWMNSSFRVEANFASRAYNMYLETPYVNSTFYIYKQWVLFFAEHHLDEENVQRCSLILFDINFMGDIREERGCVNQSRQNFAQ